MTSVYVLQYKDAEDEVHVTLHNSLEEAQTYRLLIISNLIGEGVMEEDESPAADVIIDLILSGDMDQAYEEFMHWCEHSEDHESIFFDIRESHVLPPTTMFDIYEALNTVHEGEVEVEVIDMKQGPVRPSDTIKAAPSPLAKNPLLDRLEQVANDLSAANSGASLAESKLSEEEKSKVFGYGRYFDGAEEEDEEVDEQDLVELDAMRRGGYRIRPGKHGLLEVVDDPEPKRIDGAHMRKSFISRMAGDMMEMFTEGVLGGLTANDEAVTVREREREYPKVRHTIKKTSEELLDYDE